MDRKDFLKSLALFTAGIAAPIPRFNLASAAQAKPVSKPDLTVGEGKNYFELTREVIRGIGGMSKFVKAGDTVVVKPNIGWDRNPEQGANTHPMVVKAVIQEVLDAGAGRVKVFDYTCNEPRRCYVNSGIQEAVRSFKQKKVEIFHIDRRKFVPVEIADGRTIDKWEFYKDALEADSYINVPVAKHHGLAGLTLGLKNVMGVIGNPRGRIHHHIGRKLADLATVIRPKLTIIDATRMLVRNGPQGGNLDDVHVANTVLASPDPVAVDAYATSLFGLSPDSIASTVKAFEMGLGEIHLKNVNIKRL